MTLIPTILAVIRAICRPDREVLQYYTEQISLRFFIINYSLWLQRKYLQQFFSFYLFYSSHTFCSFLRMFINPQMVKKTKKNVCTEWMLLLLSMGKVYFLTSYICVYIYIISKFRTPKPKVRLDFSFIFTKPKFWWSVNPTWPEHRSLYRYVCFYEVFTKLTTQDRSYLYTLWSALVNFSLKYEVWSKFWPKLTELRLCSTSGTNPKLKSDFAQA